MIDSHASKHRKCPMWNKEMSGDFRPWNKLWSLIFKTLQVFVWDLIQGSWAFVTRHNGKRNCLLIQSTRENNGKWTSKVVATTLVLQKYQIFNAQAHIFLKNMFIYLMSYICLIFESWFIIFIIIIIIIIIIMFFNTNSLFLLLACLALGKLFAFRVRS